MSFRKTLQKMLFGKTKDSSMQFIRYFISGSIGAGCDIAIFYLSTQVLGIHYLISNIIGFSFSLVLTYLLNVFWVFTGSKMKNRFKEFLIFVALCLASLAISELLLLLMISFIGIDKIVSKVVATLFVVMFNFTLRRKYLFR